MRLVTKTVKVLSTSRETIAKQLVLFRVPEVHVCLKVHRALE